MLQEMILQNRNHPSIILWGVRINESVDDDAFYPPVWLVCNIKINVSAEYTQGATKGLLNQKLSLSSHIYRSR